MHSWKFIQKGGFDQVIIETSEDISNLKELNRKLWATLSCPIDGVYFDELTLKSIDDDNDGKIRVSEILASVKYLEDRLFDLKQIIPSTNKLSLEGINKTTDEGKLLYQASKQILLALGKADDEFISLDDVIEAQRQFRETSYNGDGIITEEGLESDELKELFRQILSLVDSVVDTSGEVGINQALLDDFESKLTLFDECVAEFDSHNELKFENYQEAVEAVDIYDELCAKIENYFVRDSLIGFDQNAKSALSPEVDFYREFVNSDLNGLHDRLLELPISIARGDGKLNLFGGVNPKYSASLTKFNELFIVRLFGRIESIDIYQFELIKQKIAGYKESLARRAEFGIADFDEDFANRLKSSGIMAKLKESMQKDAQFSAVALYMDDLEKLLRLCENFYTLLNNFVVFRDFYANGREAIFQAGTLFIDGRSCDLCVKVSDIAKHAELASLSKTYLLYCECSREAGEQKMTIAATVTNGDSDNLMVGRNGIFYDRAGLEWDATVVRIIDFPISVRQAFWLPYKKTGEFIRNQIEKFAKAREQGTIVMTQSVIKPGETKPVSQPVAVAPAPVPAPTPFDVGKFAGIFAAIGLAIGAIGTAIASIISGFLALKFWQMPLVLVVVILAISLPSMLYAWIKLRQRNLGPLLDACGWAINTRAKINVPFGTTLTQVAELPKGSSRTMNDPFEEKDPKPKIIVFTLLLVAVMVAGYFIF